MYTCMHTCLCACIFICICICICICIRIRIHICICTCICICYMSMYVYMSMYSIDSPGHSPRINTTYGEGEIRGKAAGQGAGPTLPT